MKKPIYGDSVFINCPFDAAYQPILHAIVYAVYRCGFYPRTAMDEDDGSDNRLTKITRIIKDSKFGIHDISRVELNVAKLPRFNMPFELGLFFGAKNFGTGIQKEKKVLVFEAVKFSYQQFLSDLNGIDPKAHNNNPHAVIIKVRDWLKINSGRNRIPGPALISAEYDDFLIKLPDMLIESKLDKNNLLLDDYRDIVEEFILQKLSIRN